MKLTDYILRIAPRSFLYRAARRGWIRPINPLTLTFSVTAACQSRCKTCHIGSRYHAEPQLAEQNLSLDEINRVFHSLGSIFFFNISGGEPFMRPDLDGIVRAACLHLKPQLIHIPTNAIAPEIIAETTCRILDVMDKLTPASVPLTIKPSIDGIGSHHDEIRGFKGNFERLEKTLDLLLDIRRTNPRLHVDLGTVISRFNLEHLDRIEDWVHHRGIESYRHEIAEQRAEFYNLDDSITPPLEAYQELVTRFKRKIVEHIGSKAPLTRITEAVRIVYYDLAVEILKQQRQITPCYGGISNIHMNYDGEIWPCCVLGNQRAMGSVREWDYDIQALLRSEQAQVVRAYISAGNCSCPLANQWLINILLTWRHMFKAVRTFFSLCLCGRSGVSSTTK